jgi:hypothetical protein
MAQTKIAILLLLAIATIGAIASSISAGRTTSVHSKRFPRLCKSRRTRHSMTQTLTYIATEKRCDIYPIPHIFCSWSQKKWWMGHLHSRWRYLLYGWASGIWLNQPIYSSVELITFMSGWDGWRPAPPPLSWVSEDLDYPLFTWVELLPPAPTTGGQHHRPTQVP